MSLERHSNEPSCSLVIPTYRRSVQLAECLEALVDLDYPRECLEVLVIDDGGGVALRPIVEPFRDRLQLQLLTEERSSPAAARNCAAARARGELLAFTDDDCRPARDWLRVIASRYRADPSSGFGGHTVNSLRRNLYASASQLIIDVGYAHLNSNVQAAQFLTTNNLVVPAAGFHALDGFDPSFRTAEDRDFCARWIAQGRKLTYVPEAIVHHAHHLAFLGFCRQHFAYGRGSFRFHREQARRWNRRIRIDGAYYGALTRAWFGPERLGTKPTLAALLAVWHLNNTAGFVWEWVRGITATGVKTKAGGCRVLHLSWSGKIGGIERQLAALARRGAKREPGVIHVCLLDGRGAIGDALAAEGLATQLKLGPGWNPLGLWQLARMLRRLQPPILHFHAHSLGPLVVSCLVLPRALRVYTEHSPRVFRTKDRKFRFLYWFLRRTCSRFVALAPALEQAMARRGIDRARICLIPNTVETSRRETVDCGRNEILGIVARLVSSKRIDLLVDVVAELRRRGVDCEALIVGDGPLLAELQRHAQARGVGESVRFAGEQDPVVPWLDRIGVFLLTSAAETYSKAALEAMARGVPVVAMPCDGGLADLAARGGQLLADRGVTTAADAVAELLASSKQRERLRERGYEVAAQHSLDAVSNQLSALYDELERQPTHPPATASSSSGSGGPVSLP